MPAVSDLLCSTRVAAPNSPISHAEPCDGVKGTSARFRGCDWNLRKEGSGSNCIRFVRFNEYFTVSCVSSVMKEANAFKSHMIGFWVLGSV